MVSQATLVVELLLQSDDAGLNDFEDGDFSGPAVYKTNFELTDVECAVYGGVADGGESLAGKNGVGYIALSPGRSVDVAAAEDVEFVFPGQAVEGMNFFFAVYERALLPGAAEAVHVGGFSVHESGEVKKGLFCHPALPVGFIREAGCEEYQTAQVKHERRQRQRQRAGHGAVNL